MTSGSPTPTTATSGLEDVQTGAGVTEDAEGGTDDLRAEMARLLVERFSPENLDPKYRAEVERHRMAVPDPVDTSAMVSFPDTDGYRSMRPLTFGEIVDVLLAAGFRRVPEDAEEPDAIDEIARVVRERESVRFDAREAQRPEGTRAYLTPWPELPEHTKDHYRERVEDVLAALRGGEQQ